MNDLSRGGALISVLPTLWPFHSSSEVRCERKMVIDFMNVYITENLGLPMSDSFAMHSITRGSGILLVSPLSILGGAQLFFFVTR